MQGILIEWGLHIWMPPCSHCVSFGLMVALRVDVESVKLENDGFME